MTKNKSSHNNSLLNYISDENFEKNKEFQIDDININKDIVRRKIVDKDFEFFEHYFKNSSESNIIRVLSYFGKLSNKFPLSIFEYLLKTYQSEKLRFLVVKNLGRIGNLDIVNLLKPLLLKENNTLIRREIISSIGRLRNESNLDLLINSLKDNDPKVVMQGIRALLYFKDIPKVKESLLHLKSHKNETIKEIINIELLEKKGESKQEKKEKIEKYLPFIKNSLVLGDTRDILKVLPDECIHLTFTSPPYYNARDYSIYSNYEDYLNFLTEVIKEVHRVTYEGRFFILNTSPIIIPRFSRKYSSHRFAIPFDIHPRIINLGFEFIEDIIWKKPDPSAINRNGGFFQHRKPLGYKANSVLEYVMVYRKKTHRLIDWNMEHYSEEIIEKSKVNEDYEKTNLWNIAPTNDKIHPAVFPEELVKWVLKFYSFIGDIVLDPFAGSSTVGIVCQKYNRYFFLTENSEKYFNYSKSRLSSSNLLSAFPAKFYNYHQFKKNLEELKS
ncbi:MAG: DNA methyltransferase [Candidatus Odinarchaeota archaeon]